LREENHPTMFARRNKRGIAGFDIRALTLSSDPAIWADSWMASFSRFVSGSDGQRRVKCEMSDFIRRSMAKTADVQHMQAANACRWPLGDRLTVLHIAYGIVPQPK
jgi:hypothetical protein